jgi:hypothetical protein
LWFEGQRAFKRLPGLPESEDIEDRYAVEGAYTTTGKRRLIIAGVGKAPEKTWLHYMVALKRLERFPPEETARVFTDAVYLGEVDKWVFYLALSELDRLQKKRLAQLQAPAERNAYQAEIQAVAQEVQIRIQTGAEKRGRRAVLYTRLNQPAATARERRAVLGQLLDIDPSDSDILMEIIYAEAITGEWDRAVQMAQA